MTKFPETVPVLSGEDFVKGHLGNMAQGEACGHCSVGWLGCVFISDKYNRSTDETWHALSPAIRDTAVWAFKQVFGGNSFYNSTNSLATVVRINDSPVTSHSKLAKAFNLMTAKLGYVVGNPEAKTLRQG